jgi:hypothetical protein
LDVKSVPSYQGSETTVLIVNDITFLMKNQQKLIDHMYQDAIEQNFSHEQMTPLNSIVNSSKLCTEKVDKMYKYLEQMKLTLQTSKTYQELISEKDVTNKLMVAVRQSGIMLLYYN